MKKEIVSILIENDGFLIKERDGIRFVRIMPHNINKIPNIPFYHTMWTYHGEYIKPEINEIKDFITDNYGKISNCNGLIARPADIFPVDVRMLEETFHMVGLSSCTYISKTSLLAINNMPNYIALSTSERLVILEWYHNGKSVEKVFYNKSAVNRNKLFNDIGNIRYKANNNNLEMYIFDGCNELVELYEIGQAITAPGMIEMMRDAQSKLPNRKKNKKR